jgi:hypothetical protein
VLLLLLALVRTASARDEFAYLPGEREVFRSTFATTNGWDMPDMFVANGELFGNAGAYWMKAVHTLAAPLDLDDGELALYWSFRTDANQSEDGAAVYLRLNFTDTPSIIEQYNVTMNVRPGQFGGPPIHAGRWLLYVDPGYFIPHTADSELRPAISFTSTNLDATFRLTMRKVGEVVRLTPFFWNGAAWEMIQPQAGFTVPLEANVTTALTNNQVVRSLEVQFFQATPAVDAIALTQRPPAPRFLSLTNDAGGIGFEWFGGDPPYRLEQRADWFATNWTVVQSNLTSAATWWHPTTNGASFFRVRGQ